MHCLRVLAATLLCTALGGTTATAADPTDRASLPLLAERDAAGGPDWLIDDSSYKAGLFRTAGADEIALDNGLLRRTFRVAPNGATVGFD